MNQKRSYRGQHTFPYRGTAARSRRIGQVFQFVSVAGNEAIRTAGAQNGVRWRMPIAQTALANPIFRPESGPAYGIGKHAS